MTLKDWLFEAGDFVNPYYAGQWKMLHIITLVLIIVVLIFHLYIVLLILFHNVL